RRRSPRAALPPPPASLARLPCPLVTPFCPPMKRLHYDTPHLLFYGVYEASQPHPDDLPLPPRTPSADFPPAHITHGYLSIDTKMIHAGLCSVVDDQGAVPLFGHTVSGNDNNYTAIAQQCQLLQDYLHPDPLLLASDRAPYSAGHAARLHHAGHHVLCSVPWHEFQPLFSQQRQRLTWKRASFLSVEQQRRRQAHSRLPQEYYDLAVLRHQVIHPDTHERIPCRVLFVFSSADQKVCQKQPQRTAPKPPAGRTPPARTEAGG